MTAFRIEHDVGYLSPLPVSCGLPRRSSMTDHNPMGRNPPSGEMGWAEPVGRDRPLFSGAEKEPIPKTLSITHEACNNKSFGLGQNVMIECLGRPK